MPRKINPEKVVEVLQWKYENNASAVKTAKHFKMDRKTVSRWEEDFDIDDLRAEFKIEREFGTRSITVEKRIPDGIKEECDLSLMNLSKISYNVSLSLARWTEDMLEKVQRSGPHVLKPWELDRLIRVGREANIYTIPSASDITDDSATLHETVKSKLAEARNKLEEERKRRIKS